MDADYRAFIYFDGDCCPYADCDLRANVHAHGVTRDTYTHKDGDKHATRHTYMDPKPCPICDVLRNSNGYPNGNSTFTYAHGYDGANPNSHTHFIRTAYLDGHADADTDPQLQRTGAGRPTRLHSNTYPGGFTDANSYPCTGPHCHDADKPHRHRYAGGSTDPRYGDV